MHVCVTCLILSGRIAKIYYPTGTVAKVGTPLCDIEMDAALTDDSAPTPAPTHAATPAKSAPSSASTAQPSSSSPSCGWSNTAAASGKQIVNASKVLASPAVRFLAKKENVDLTGLRGMATNGIDD